MNLGKWLTKTRNKTRMLFHIISNQHHTGSIRQCQSCGFSSSHVRMWAVAAAKSLQSCPTLCDRIDGSPPGSSVRGTFQARVLKFPSLGHLPHPGVDPVSPASAGGFFITEPPGKPTVFICPYRFEIHGLIHTHWQNKDNNFCLCQHQRCVIKKTEVIYGKKKQQKKLCILGVNSAISGSFTVLTASHGKYWIHLHTSL